MSRFSRLDYEWLAGAWATLLAHEPYATDRAILQSALDRFANLLKAQSPNFDRDLFISNALSGERRIGPTSPNRKAHSNG